MSKPNSRTNNRGGTTLVRRLSQAAMLVVLGQWSFYGLFRCPFPVPFVSCLTCPVITCYGRIVSLFWGFWLLLPTLSVLFGRAFCGWACPGGLVVQLSGKVAPVKLRLRNIFNRTARYGKYLGLAAALFLWLYLGNPRWAVPIRIGEVWASIGLTFEHANSYWLVRTFAVLGFAAGGLVLANLWCRFACPTGGLLEVFGRFSLIKFYRTGQCNDCDACLKVCEMGTRPAEANCTNCGDCRHVCPVDAIRFGRQGD